MKLLRKIALIICIVSTSILSTEAFALSAATLPGGVAGPGTTLSIPLTGSGLLYPNVIYSVQCPITVTGAGVGETSIITNLGINCPTLGACCSFKKPSLTNLGDVGPRNGNGAYQSAINVSGTTVYTDRAVSQIGTGDTLTFSNIDGTATVTVGSCTATPVTTPSNH